MWIYCISIVVNRLHVSVTCCGHLEEVIYEGYITKTTKPTYEYELLTLGFCDRASWANCEVKEKTNKMQQLDVYYQYFLSMFRASLRPSSGEQDVCYCT